MTCALAVLILRSEEYCYMPQRRQSTKRGIESFSLSLETKSHFRPDQAFHRLRVEHALGVWQRRRVHMTIPSVNYNCCSVDIRCSGREQEDCRIGYIHCSGGQPARRSRMLNCHLLTLRADSLQWDQCCRIIIFRCQSIPSTRISDQPNRPISDCAESINHG